MLMMQAWGIWGLKLLTASKVDPGYINSLISLGRCQGLCGGGLFTLCHTCQNECNYRKCFLPLKILLNHFFCAFQGYAHICYMYMVTVPLYCMSLVCKLHFTFLLLWKNSRDMSRNARIGENGRNGN